jgi:D-arabinose 5-phosphate isomerase GutQ
MAASLDEQLLDDPDALAAADRSGALLTLATAGAQVREAVVRGQEAGVCRLADDERPRSVLVASLGGSGIIGDVLSVLAGAGSALPVTVRRGLPLPGWVGPLDLVMAASLSGRARGPLALAAEAGRRGCRLVTVGAPGSPLADVCAQARGLHVPVSVRRHRDAPEPGPVSSRAALWSLLVPVLQAGHAVRAVDAPDAVLAAAADALDEEAEAARPSSESFVNPAKSLALQLAGHVPVVLADGPVTDVAARRAVAMLARTARTPAMQGSLPDDASEVVATFDGPFTPGQADVFADPFLDPPSGPTQRLLLVREPAPEPGRDDQAAFERAALADRVRELARDVGVPVSEVTAEPGHDLVRLALLVARLDFTATYLALGMGLDPATSPHVADLRDAR